LGKFMIAAVLFITHESEAVRAQHCAGMHHHTAPQRGTRRDAAACIQVKMVADHRAPADAAARSNVGALADYSVGSDRGVGVYSSGGSDFRGSVDDSRGMNEIGRAS